ncbi:hypothetical protein [Shewanella livingstonensis]|uniref:Uncharacterized protein n=1 Tax=Shewanella livingstonensis TaxID=150120 RepID=A0A3G8LVL3_9GAMM|nr:hypothetical protein [Shewanella livingstonensis]AZG73661.1 hypothetical protein EGC82_13355 [Shewanella livingstonensis]
MQLSFSSFMKIVCLISLAFAGVMTILLRAVVIIGAEPGIDELTFSTWIMGYMLGGMFGGFFITSWMSAAISFGVYSLICNKQKGQRVTGKFAVLVKSASKAI